MDDIAKRARVSKSLVSRVLGNVPTSVRVSEQTRQRILMAANDLQYVPDLRARFLTQRRSSTVGVLIQNVRGHTRPIIVDAISAHLLQRKQELLLGVHHSTTEASLQHVRAFRSYRTRGVIVVSGSDTLDRQVIDALVQGRADCGPFVCVNTVGPTPNVPLIQFDSRGAIQQFLAAAQASDRRRALLVQGPARWRPMVDELFQQEAARREELVGEVIDLPDQGSPETCAQLVGHIRGQLQDGPLAILTMLDQMAITVIQLLQAAGIDVPSQAALVSWGNLTQDLVPPRCPRLSTFDRTRAAQRAATLAIEFLEADSAAQAEPVVQLVPQELIFRESFPPPVTA